jgi:hypothetical protein
MWLDTVNAQQVRRLPANEYRDKMKADWVGQFVAAAWGLPGRVSFQWRDRSRMHGPEVEAMDAERLAQQ